MSKRTPARDEYDAIARVTLGERSVRPFAIVKETWAFGPGRRQTLAPAVPLAGDLNGGGETETGWAPGSDFWPQKAATDVIVEGSAWAPNGGATRSSAEIVVGDRSKRVTVFGRRIVEWRGDRATISSPERFEKVGLQVQNAYGGVDHRVPIPVGDSIGDLVRGTTDHPGSYPRNPHGRGYVVVAEEPVEQEVELPGLEDPRLPLTDDNLLVRDPSAWHRQPLPAFLGWSSPAQFPRLLFAGAIPWFAVPEDEELEEVRRGLIQPDWRSLQAGDSPKIHPAFLQEASPGLVFAELPPGTPVKLRGMHPEHRELSLEVPRAPVMEIDVAGRREVCQPHLLHLVIQPDELLAKATWVAWFPDDTAMFVPKLHAEIPVAVRVNGDAPVRCEAPPTLRDQLVAATAEGLIPHSPNVLLTPSRELVDGKLHGQRPQRGRDQQAFGEALTFGNVDIATGRALLKVIDWTLAGTALSWTRYYSSTASWRDVGLGFGWTHGFHQEIWQEGGWILVLTEDGREIGIPVPGGRELGMGAICHHPLRGLTVRRIGADSYELWDAVGSWRRFVEVAQSPAGQRPRARLVEGCEPDGRRWTLGYDTHGRLERVCLGGAVALRIEHDGEGHIRTVYCPSASGQEWAVAAGYSYDASGPLRQARDARGRVHRYGYRRRVLTTASCADDERVFEYSGSQRDLRCTAEASPETDRRYEIGWDPDARLAVCTTPRRESFSVAVTRTNQVARVFDFFGKETTREYDDTTGLLSSQTTPNGETSYLYDASFHLADVSGPDQGSVALEHDEAGHLVRWTDADGHAARWGWDHLGRMSAAIDRAGVSVVYDFDGEGPLRSMLAPGEVRVVLERDPQTQAVTRVQAATGERRARRDVLGRVIEVTDELGQVTSFRYDPSGRPARVELPIGLVRAYESDGEGRVTSVRDGVSKLELERDELGRIALVDEGEPGPRLHHDAEGRVKMIESEAFDFWELIRDAAGRIVEETGFGDEKRFSLRDHDGLVKREMCGPARTMVERDRAGRPVELEHADETFQRFGWTPAGHLSHAQYADRTLELSRDGEGRVTLERVEDGHWVRSEYDSHGRRVLWQSSLGLGVRVERDALGNAMGIAAQRGEVRLELRLERDACGRETMRHLPGGLALRWRRDGIGRPIERAVMFGQRELATLRFTWAGLDRLVRVEDPQRGARDHRYDARGRLVRVGGAVRALDEVGNVYRSPARDDHRYATGGRLEETYGIEYRYDARGNRVEKETPDGSVQRYRWDGLGRLVEVWLTDEQRVVYDYDGVGRLVRRRLEQKTEIAGLDEPVWEPLAETRFLWDGLQLLHEVEGGRVTSWIWDGEQLVGKLDEDGAYAVLTDPAGMPTEMTDAKGNLVWRGLIDLFGMAELENDQVRCPWRFSGHWEDPDTGLAHSWLRVYDPETGAYLSQNPLGVIAGTNLYGYLPDPMVQRSPLGLGRGYQALRGAADSGRLHAELVGRLVRALDRKDGAAGPPSQFDPDAASVRLPDPEACLYGPWDRHRPCRRLPPPTSYFTRLPEACGLSCRGEGEPR